MNAKKMMKSGKSFQIFLLFLQTNAGVPCKKGRWYLILFCSISDTNYHLEKRLLAKNNISWSMRQLAQASSIWCCGLW